MKTRRYKPAFTDCKGIIMEKNNMYFDTHKVKVYRDIYRRSSNPYRFLGSLFSIILEGQSPVTSTYHYHNKKKNR
jgi:hypothetical protein